MHFKCDFKWISGVYRALTSRIALQPLLVGSKTCGARPLKVGRTREGRRASRAATRRDEEIECACLTARRRLPEPDDPYGCCDEPVAGMGERERRHVRRARAFRRTSDQRASAAERAIRTASTTIVAPQKTG